MNIKKILIILLFLLILTNITIGTSYAVSNEKIKIFNYKNTETFDKKIVSIDEITVSGKKYEQNVSYKINIKKANQQKYKIQSVKCEYSFWNSKTYKDETVYKTYDGKNKTSLTIKQPKDYYIELMTINYQTKTDIKKESTKLQATGINKIRFDSSVVGKKAKIILQEKGYGNYTSGFAVYPITYQKFNIKTINEKYKIKTIQVIYRDMTGKVTKTTTFNVNRKTSFTKTISGTFYTHIHAISEFKITYY